MKIEYYCILSVLSNLYYTPNLNNFKRRRTISNPYIRASGAFRHERKNLHGFKPAPNLIRFRKSYYTRIHPLDIFERRNKLNDWSHLQNFSIAHLWEEWPLKGASYVNHWGPQRPAPAICSIIPLFIGTSFGLFHGPSPMSYPRACLPTPPPSALLCLILWPNEYKGYGKRPGVREQGRGRSSPWRTKEWNRCRSLIIWK